MTAAAAPPMAIPLVLAGAVRDQRERIGVGGIEGSLLGSKAESSEQVELVE